MRTIILIALMSVAIASKAQTFIPGSFIDNSYRGGFANNFHIADSSAKNKWSLSKYIAVSDSYTFFKGGNASIISAPVVLQLNRRLNNNLYAFAGASVAPAYINFNRTFMANGYNKVNQFNNFSQPGIAGLYTRAALGLQYVNDEKTFSISGSIGVERSSFPVLPYSQINNTKTNHVMSANR